MTLYIDTTEGESNKDWGKIVHPIEGGGRTTSVSIMKQGRTTDDGVKKMGQGWLVLPKHSKMLEKICSIFNISLSENNLSLFTSS